MTDTSAPGTPARPVRKPENIWLNLACNVFLPGLIMSKLAAPERLGPVWALVAGVSLPLGYGIYDLVTRKKWNLFSGVGLLSVGLTGGLGLAHASAMAFAIKEAAVPCVLALGILATLRTSQPLVREMVLNESVVDLQKLNTALDEHGTKAQFEQLLRSCTWLVAASLLLSAVLNFVLARILLTSAPGTPEFTAALGRMNWWSWPVITLPTMAIMIVAMVRVFRGIHRLTGLDLEALMHPHHQKKK
ncbi:MAG: MFS transporter [Opitutaceae bacterium]|nr:MFS transporter [Opitutaceae bacterium]